MTARNSSSGRSRASRRASASRWHGASCRYIRGIAARGLTHERRDSKMAAKDDSNKIRNVGPKSAAWLRQVGVRTQEDLQRLGPVEAFMKVKRAGFRPSLNLL